NATQTVVTSTGTPSLAGTSVTFTATASVPGGGPTPSGSVQFKDGSTDLGTSQTLSSGQAQVDTSSLTPGQHSITADYSSDSANFNGSASTAFTQTVVEAPSITSDDHTTFTAGSLGSFPVTTTGYPAPSLSETGTLPDGVT